MSSTVSSVVSFLNLDVTTDVSSSHLVGDVIFTIRTNNDVAVTVSMTTASDQFELDPSYDSKCGLALPSHVNLTVLLKVEYH